MDVVQKTAGSVDVDLGGQSKITENAIKTEEALEKIGGRFDSRDRRKSKYLSSPYTNIRSKQKDLSAEAEDLKTPCPSKKGKHVSAATKPFNGTSSYAKLDSKRFRKNWHIKVISCCTMPSSPEFINASLHELLSGLCSAAVDCMCPVENSGFDLVEWFFCRYRVSAFHDEAEIAGSFVKEKRGKIRKTVGNDSPYITSKKKMKKNKMENSVKPKTKSLSGLLDVNTNNSCGDSHSPKTSKKPGKKRKGAELTSLPQRKKVGISSSTGSSIYNSVPKAPPKGHQTAEMASGSTRKKGRSLVIDLQLTSPAIPEKSNDENKEETVSNAKLCSHEPAGNITNEKLLVSPASEVGSVKVNKTGLKSRMKKAIGEPLNTASEVDSVSVNKVGRKSRMGKSRMGKSRMGRAVEDPPNTKLAVGCITNNSLLVSTASEIGSVSVNQTGLKSRSEKGVEEPLNTRLSIGNITNHSSMVTSASEVGSVSVNKVRLKNRMERQADEPLNTKLAVEIPDLNCTNAEFETINFLSPGSKSEQSRSLSACSKHTKTTSRVESNGESLGTCLLLQFAPGVYALSREDLMTTFCRFGPLKASETQLLKDIGSAQIVFVQSADAAEAFRFLEQNKQFPIGGSTVIDSKLQDLPAACPPPEQLMTPTQPTGAMLMPGMGHPPLQFIKQNLQMMTSILEKSGSNLSPQMRAKLDAEINNLMQKVNSRTNV